MHNIGHPRASGPGFVTMVRIDGTELRCTSFAAEQQHPDGPFHLSLAFPVVTTGERIHELLTRAVLNGDDNTISCLDISFPDGLRQRYEKIRGIKTTLEIQQSQAISVSAVLLGEPSNATPPARVVDYLKPARIYTWNDGTATVEGAKSVIEAIQIRSISVTVERDLEGIRESGHVTVIGSNDEFDTSQPAIIHVGYQLKTGRFKHSYEFQSDAPRFTKARLLDDNAPYSPVFETKFTWQTR